MILGIPKEIKDNEFRVAISPEGVMEIAESGAEIYVESKAGEGIGFHDQDYEKAGAKILKTKKELYEKSDLIVKVKEPQPEECALFKEGQILFSYLHLAAEKKMTEMLLQKKIIGIAFETVTDEQNKLPLLYPMSEIAGKLSTQQGAHYLEKKNGGKGLLMGGALGCEAATVLILGGGTVGMAAAEIAFGMGARVVIFERSFDQMRHLKDVFGKQVEVVYSSTPTLRKYLPSCDLLIGTILIPGAAAPKIVTREMIKLMQPGSVVVDVSIDQGGCMETSKPTSHSNPIYFEEKVLHYCVTNMPAAVPLTSSRALEKNILPYVLRLCKNPVEKILSQDKHFADGLQVFKGQLTSASVASSLGLSYSPVKW